MIKIKHRILTVLLSATMICSGFNAFAENAQESFVSEYIPLESEEFDALNTMGLLGDETANMSATQEITRAQFVGDLYKIAGYSKYEYTGGDIPFIDVNVDTVYKDEICYFYNAGFVKGISGSIFAPEDKITYVQAVKLIVDVLGYTEYTAKKYGLYPNGYIAMANVLELPEGIKIGDMNSPLTADKAIRLLYNAGRTNIMETSGFTSGGEITYEISGGNELLSQNNHIYYGEGIVQNNGIVSLITGERKENTAVIDSKEYIIADNIDITAFLGCRVKYFYKSESGSDETLLWAACHTRNDIITVKSEDLMPEDPAYSGTNIVYMTDNKKKQISVNKYADIFYNYMIYNDYSVLKPKSGTMKFIDNDNDNVYDIVIVEEFDNIFVKSVSINGGFIADKYGNTIFLDDYKNVRIIENGKSLELAEIKNDCVVSFVKSPDNEYIYIYVNDTGKSERLEAIGEDNEKKTYYFSDGEYKIASSYEELISQGKYITVIPEVGENYKYYLDMSGNIAEIQKSEERSLMYAYLIDAAADDSVLAAKDTALVRLLLENGEKITALTDKKIRLNGVDGKTGTDLLESSQLWEDGEILNQVVMVAFDAEGNIDEFKFAQGNTSEYGYDNTTFTCDYSGNTRFNSKHTYMIENKYTIGRDAIIFAKYNNLEENEPFFVIKPNVIETDNKHNVSLYDCDETLTPKAVSVELTADSMFEQRIVLVDKAKYVKQDDGEFYMQIAGYSFGEPVTYTELYEHVFPDNLKRGDLLKISLYNNRVLSTSVLCRLSTDTSPFIDGYGSRFCTIFGEVYSVGNNGILTVNPQGHANGKLTATSFKGKTYLKVQIYDKNNDEISIGTISDLVQVSEPQTDGTLLQTDSNTRAFLFRRSEYLMDAVIVYY